MNKELKKQKILHLATIDENNVPHIVPVWYMQIRKKFYVGTNTKTKKAKNIAKNNRISFCIDVGVWSPVNGMMGTGKAKIIKKKDHVKRIAGKILLRYFDSLEKNAAKKLLENTNCVIEITPRKIISWHY